MLLSLLLATAAQAQMAPVVSLAPMIAELGQIISTVEGDGYQITDMTIGRVFGGQETSVPVQMYQDDAVLVVGLGDRERIEDLDLRVLDDRGVLVAQDEMPDPNPVVAFEAPRTGMYRARVHAAKTYEGYTGGFFVLVTAYPLGSTPVSVEGTFYMVTAAIELLEQEGYQVLHGEWETVLAHDAAAVEVDLEAGRSCRAVAVGSPDRLKRLNFYVLGPENQLVVEERAREEVAVVDFTPEVSGRWMLVVEANKLRRAVSDTHAALVVGCQ